MIARSVRLPLALVAALALASCAAPPTPGPRMGPGGMMGSGGMMAGRADSTCSASPSPSSATVHVTLADMGMMGGSVQGDAPLGIRMMLRTDVASVPAGQVTFVAADVGRRVHELVVLPLGAGEAAGQRVPGSDGKVDESGSLGEASASCAEGTGEGIAPGTIGWVTLTLAPGRYELVCNMTNHYADGMWQELVVT